ncbi:hypothetical protein HBI08_199840 [Parastagonospora nodorum]|nr:hypothetical protein HBI08_199840 [Parastagonospora nodorum]
MAVICCAYFTDRKLHSQLLPFVAMVPFTTRTVGHENMRTFGALQTFFDPHRALGFLHMQRCGKFLVTRSGHVSPQSQHRCTAHDDESRLRGSMKNRHSVIVYKEKYSVDTWHCATITSNCQSQRFKAQDSIA